MPVSTMKEVLPGIAFGADSCGPGRNTPCVIVPITAMALLTDEEIGRAARSMLPLAECMAALDYAERFIGNAGKYPYRDCRSDDFQDQEWVWIAQFSQEEQLLATAMGIRETVLRRHATIQSRDAALRATAPPGSSLTPGQILRRDLQKNYDKLFVKIGRRDGFCCRRCQRNTALEIDHVVGLANGGTNDLANLQLLCQGCNSSKSDKE